MTMRLPHTWDLSGWLFIRTGGLSSQLACELLSTAVPSSQLLSTLTAKNPWPSTHHKEQNGGFIF